MVSAVCEQLFAKRSCQKDIFLLVLSDGAKIAAKQNFTKLRTRLVRYEIAQKLTKIENNDERLKIHVDSCKIHIENLKMHVGRLKMNVKIHIEKIENVC